MFTVDELKLISNALLAQIEEDKASIKVLQKYDCPGAIKIFELSMKET